MKSKMIILALSFMSAASFAAASAAKNTATAAGGYDQPPKNILDVLHAPSLPVPVVSPTQDNVLLVSLENYPQMERVAAPYIKLAGVRLEPQNRSRHDTPGGYGIPFCAKTLEFVHVADGVQRKIALPADSCPLQPQWSADGKQFAYANMAKDSVELWIGDVQSGKVHRIAGVHMNPIFDDEFQWLADQKRLLVKLVPAKMGNPPAEARTPSGPSIQETGGEKGQSSTYETRDTLNNKHDEDLFDYYGSSQLAVVDIASGKVTPIGQPHNFYELAPAPDGKHILVTWIHRPYSYITTYDRFPKEVEVWEIAGATPPVIKTMASLPLADRVPIHGVPVGPRDFAWRATDPATLVWAEALDGGDWNVKVPFRDKVMSRKAPFTANATELFKTEQRFEGFMWSEQPNVAFLREYDHNRHWKRRFVVDVDHPETKPRLIWDLSTDEKYADPGGLVHRRLPNGYAVVRQEGNSVYLSGMGSSPEGDRPFLDKFDLTTLKSQRLFRSDANSFEQFVSFTGPNTQQFLTWHQSLVDPPNLFLRQLGAPVDVAKAAPSKEAAKDVAHREPDFVSTSTAITHISDPTPEVRAIKKRLVKYKRADGLDLSFTLYTPPDYKEGTRVPTILYAYPLDYADATQAGQVTGSQVTFTRLRQYKLLLLAGYAIIDNAAFPIVGDPKKAYDTYMDQLVADAKAAVDEAVRIGVADPERIGVTGHSHGALMTVNLVAHSGLFKAGVATSGSYNKTLTPFGFQNERRSVWEAPEVYQKVSPFFFADKLKTPILIMHGADDANPGTTPLQASKLYEAIRGNGGTARLVMLPHEPHWYSAMESNEQLIYEMLRWFDKYVKNAVPAKTASSKD